ncbi:alpha/beta hydrolase [Pendulispora rubella]|uniref:Alpha/beta hydrolase n=1 Tax=Pendulispora rubella TaxID=2741070 RepID=A0ABZ2LHA5_9BACT
MQLGIAHGVDLHVQELGSGPPVVMLHGLFGNLATWYFTTAAELSKSHRVIVYDLRGHGRSARTPYGYDVATMAGDLDAVVEQVAQDDVTLVGHSYGGVIALAYALRCPHRVRKLALIEAPLPPLDTGELWSRYTAVAKADTASMLASLPNAVRDALVAGGRRAGRFLETVRFLSLESSLRDDLARAEMSDAALASLACPLLAVYGTASGVRPSGERLARVVAGTDYVTLEGGHDLPQESPVALTRELVRFIDG